MARRKDVDWNLPEGSEFYWSHVQIAVLMDIRDELKRLNSLLHCHNFTGIPHVLRGIRAKLPTRKRRKQPPNRAKKGKKK